MIAGRDITARKQAEAALQSANQSLENALHLKNEFIATMGHELRRPLTAILGTAQALAVNAGRLAEKELQGVEVIEKGGQRLLKLLNNILELSQLHTCSSSRALSGGVHLSIGFGCHL